MSVNNISLRMIGSCSECGHTLILRGNILLHATENYSGKLCMYVSKIDSKSVKMEKHCNCINPQLPRCKIHPEVFLSLDIENGECPFCIAENPDV